MTYHTYSIFDIHLTENEYKTVRTFCQMLDSYMEEVDSYKEVFDFICGVAWGRDIGHNKITITEEE